MRRGCVAEVPYDSLPLLPGSGLRHAWHVFGEGDEVGTVNRITADAVSDAARLITLGRRIGLTLPISLPDPPLFGREAARHAVHKGKYGWGDHLDGFDPQVSTQWDGLRHIRGNTDGFYGGWMGDDEHEPERLGVQRWAEAGIVGRGVLVDMAADVDPFAGIAITPEQIRSALEGAGTEVRRGDILCVRTGWAERYLELSPQERVALAAEFADGKLAAWCGLQGDDEMARFLWDSGFSAVAVDNPGVEVSPGDPWFGTLHRRLIPCLGFAIGELFRLGPLSQACLDLGRWEFFFVSVPLNFVGGVGSPANAVAIL
jgi:kynurenine formamidase